MKEVFCIGELLIDFVDEKQICDLSKAGAVATTKFGAISALPDYDQVFN